MNIDTSVAKRMLREYLKFKAEKYPIWGGLVRRYEEAVSNGGNIEEVLNAASIEDMEKDQQIQPAAKEPVKRGRKKNA